MGERGDAVWDKREGMFRMTDKKAKIKASVFIFVFAAIVGGLSIWLVVTIIDGMTRFYNRPEQSAQVEVVSKRIRVDRSSGKHASYIDHYYIVTFKFSDGSVKELEVDWIHQRNSNKEVYSSAYDSMHEGDAGLLIYKEISNIEKKYKNNEDMCYDGRFLISFERDSQYGELKIESTEQQFETWHFILLGALVIMWLLFAVLLVKGIKKALKYICRDET